MIGDKMSIEITKLNNSLEEKIIKLERFLELN
jgi:hypothetical protein